MKNAVFWYVDIEKTDISEERVASIFRGEIRERKKVLDFALRIFLP
jgi:hypothetical protein